MAKLCHIKLRPSVLHKRPKREWENKQTKTQYQPHLTLTTDKS